MGLAWNLVRDLLQDHVGPVLREHFSLESWRGMVYHIWYGTYHMVPYHARALRQNVWEVVVRYPVHTYTYIRTRSQISFETRLARRVPRYREKSHLLVSHDLAARWASTNVMKCIPSSWFEEVIHALTFRLKCNFGCILTAQKVGCFGVRFS